MEWMVLPLQRYADFQGRSRRKEYWLFTLLTIICYTAFWVIFSSLAAIMSSRTPHTGAQTAFGVFGIVMFFVMIASFLAILIPTLAVQVRRLHDRDQSGWLLLLNFIPLGGFILLIFFCLEGTVGENRYGPDPKRENEHLGDVFR